jgi:hypothetical protein
MAGFESLAGFEGLEASTLQGEPVRKERLGAANHGRSGTESEDRNAQWNSVGV